MYNTRGIATDTYNSIFITLLPKIVATNKNVIIINAIMTVKSTLFSDSPSVMR